MSWMHVKSTELITNVNQYNSMQDHKLYNSCIILSILFTLARIHILKRAINPLYNKNEELAIRVI